MGPAAALLELVEVGALELLVSDACIEELREVLTRPSLQRKFPSLTISAVQQTSSRLCVPRVMLSHWWTLSE